jgi:CelD/BcsL family acetyltransferase involved in cellulose biosynthesis
MIPIESIAVASWRDLAERAIEPNGYYLPDWERTVSASARGLTDAFALAAWVDPQHLSGLLPVISMRRAYAIPLPALVSAHPYGTLDTPLLDGAAPVEAASALLHEARRTGAHAIILRDLALDGASLRAFSDALAKERLAPLVLHSHARAFLNATQDAEGLLRAALGAKKLKELRRQRNRLADHGDVAFEVARTVEAIGPALETFLALEASGWKARRGTALVQHAGDAAFIRAAVPAMAARGHCEMITLRAGGTPVASGIVLRHQDRAFYFKLGVDEAFAKYSPGVQLTIDLTRHLCADPAIAGADSTAAAGHPMIDPIWRDRLRIGDVLIPLRRSDPMVAAIRAALMLRRSLREPARRAVRFIRQRQEKSE